MISEQLAELFTTLSFKIDAKGLKGLEKRLESLEKQIKSLANGQEKTAKTAAKATKSQADATEQAAKSTKKQATAVKSLDKAYSNMYRNQKKNLKSVIAELGGKGGVSPMTQFMRQMQAMQRTATGANAQSWQKNFQKSVAELTSGSGGSRGGQAFYDKLFGAVPQIQAKAKNANAWARNFQASVGALGPQSQSEMSKYYASLEKEQVKVAKQAESQRKSEVRDQRQLLNIERTRVSLAAARQRMEQQAAIHQQRMVRMQQQASRFAPGGSGLVTGNPNQWSGGLLGAMGGAAAGGFGLSGLWEKNREILATQVMLESVTGGEQGGIAAREWLVTQARRLGFDFLQVSPEYGKLLAAATPQVGLETAQKTFRSFSELATVRKMGGFERKRMFYALQQMFSKEKVMTQELQEQMAESGFVDARQIFAQAWKNMGKTSSLEKAMEKGEVKTAEIMPFVLALIDEKNRVSLDKAMKSSIAGMGRMRTELNLLFKIWSEAGGDKAFGELFDKVAEGLFRSQKAAESFGKSFQNFLGPLRAAARLFGDIADTWLPKLSSGLDIAEEDVIFLSAAIVSLFVPFLRWITILGGLVVILEDVSAGLKEQESVTKHFIEWLGGGEFELGLSRLSTLAVTLASIYATAKAMKALGALGEIFGDGPLKKKGPKTPKPTDLPPVESKGFNWKDIWQGDWRTAIVAATVGAGAGLYNVYSDPMANRTPQDAAYMQERGELLRWGPKSKQFGLGQFAAPEITFGDIKVQMDIASLDPNTDLNAAAQGLAEALREQMKGVTREVLWSEINTAGMAFTSSNIE